MCMPDVWFDDDAFEQLSCYVNSSKGAYAPNTERARLSDSRIFAEWCQDERKEFLPSRPETIAAFIDAMAETRAPATVRRYATSISHLHRAAGLANPCNDELVRLALRRMHRAKGRRGNQKLGLTRDLVDRMLAADPGTLKGLRDHALLSVTYDSLCRRSELVAADVEHVELMSDGSGILFLPHSKTDLEGQGAYRYLAPDTMR